MSGVGVLPVIRTIGFFGVKELDPKPIFSPEEMKKFLKPIAWSKINRIHSGERPEVGRKYVNFQKNNLNNVILLNTERIERAVNHFERDSEGKLKIFARTAVLSDLVAAILHASEKAKPKNFEFVFNKDKKELKIWAIKYRKNMNNTQSNFVPFVEKTLTTKEEMSRRNMNNIRPDFGLFVDKTLTTEREIPADELVYYGYQGTYQLTQLVYPEFVVYTSKEINAVEKVKKGGDAEEFSVYEIKSPSNLKNFRIDHILLKNVAFAKVNKLIVGELGKQGETTIIKQIRVVDNVESLDSSNLVEACRRELGKVLDSILDLVKDYPNGTLSTSYQGIHFNKPNGEKSLIAKPKLKNGTPKSHEMRYVVFDKSDVQYLLDPTYKFNSTWPCRDSQDFKNFLKHGFTNRKKENNVLLFAKYPKIHLKIRAKLEEEGYFYDQTMTNCLRNEYFDVFDCFVLKKTLFVEK